jgi:hypothetical protein
LQDNRPESHRDSIGKNRETKPWGRISHLIVG